MGKIFENLTYRYFDFKGTATRIEFWTFYFFYILFIFVLTLLSSVLKNVSGATLISLILNIYMLASLIPLTSCTVRRIHDAGKSGWFIFFPIYNFILLLSPSRVASIED